MGEFPGAVYLGGLASKTSWRSPVCNSMLRYHTNVIMAKVPGAADFRGRVPCTTLTRVIVRLKPSDSLRCCRTYPPWTRTGTSVG